MHRTFDFYFPFPLKDNDSLPPLSQTCFFILTQGSPMTPMAVNISISVFTVELIYILQMHRLGTSVHDRIKSMH